MRQEKGITLIALVITIIVLLILAGITIAMLGGQDSAPNKAAESKIINDVGAAKDAVALKATETIETWYESKYVSNTAGATTLQASVITAINSYTSTGVSISAETSTITIKSTATKPSDSTKVYQIQGTVDSNGGITWQAGDWVAAS